MRLFVALLLDEAAKARLLDAIAVLRQQGTGNFTRPENLHLTLAFLGETSQFRAATQALRRVQMPKVELHFQKIGAFGDLIWAGANPNPGLMTLQHAVEAELRTAGFQLEHRAFRPHLTLCRRYRPDGSFDRTPVEQALDGAFCRVGRVSLMESWRQQGKLIYTERFYQMLKD